MAIHPANDRLKVKVDKNDSFGFGDESAGAETGVVVEVPDVLIYLSFHSFGFEDSFMAEDKLKKVQEYYNQFLNKRVYWETYQDRGRRIKEGDQEYIYLQMTDVLAHSDNADEVGIPVEDNRQGGFKV